MAEKVRNRDRGLARRRPNREPKHRILIVCEGEKTEPQYFKDLRHRHRNHLIHIEVSDRHGVPKTVVEAAIDEREQAEQSARAERDENLRFDEVWAVFDVDEHPNLKEAKALAQHKGVKVALSNPCFELWGLLHLGDEHAHLHRHDAQRKLRDALKLKNEKLLPLDKLMPHYEDAVRRARALRVRAERDGKPQCNPSTNVDELTELIRKGGAR